MQSCPSDQKLSAMLVSTLNPAEQDVLAQHIESCRHCQEGLARLTRSGDEERWQRSELSAESSQVEKELLGRLKGASPPSPVKDPERIGPYRILERLGDGGMGTVYKAERRTPFKQTVAIKLIKLGYDSREVIARFDSERQALARMDHPNIARVLDAGVSDTGRPFFVMEYVPGLAITKFADDNKLTIPQRLELFTQVCQAIAHAHTKSVIHRDVKSSNVIAYMADAKPAVKVIDFGVAKALTGDRLTEQTFNTARGQVIGTYESMSPEQADGSPDIDTRTDVYSLGVLLYELLTGAKPFDNDTFAKAADKEIRQIIREVEPLRPSTRLSSLGDVGTRIAALRRAQLGALTKQLRSELEWIPLKAMRKERDRRYQTPQQLSDDIWNYLRGDPLLAGPESHIYKLKKAIRKNRGFVGAVTAVVLILALGIVATTTEAARARKAEKLALLAETSAEEATKQAIAAELRAKDIALHAQDVWLSQFVSDAKAAGAVRNWREAQDLLAKVINEHAPEPLQSEATLDLWEAFNNAPPPLMSFQLEKDPDAPVDSVAFSKDGKIAMGWAGRTLYRWSTETGAALPSDAPLVEICQTERMTPDGRIAVHPDEEHDSMLLCDARSGALLRELHGGSGTPAISSDGRYVAALDKTDLVVRVFEIATGKLTAQFSGAYVGSDGPMRFMVGEDRLVFCLGNPPAAIAIGDINSSQILFKFPVSNNVAPLVATGPGVVLICDGFHCSLYDNEGKNISSIQISSPSSEDRISACAVSLKSDCVAVAENNGIINILSAMDGKEIESHFGPICTGNKPNSLAFSPDGKLLIVGSGNGTVSLWRVQPELPTIHLVRGESNEASPEVSLSTDGLVLVSGTSVFDVQTGQILHRSIDPADLTYVFGDGGVEIGVSVRGKSRPQLRRIEKSDFAAIDAAQKGRPVAADDESVPRDMRLWAANCSAQGRYGALQSDTDLKLTVWDSNFDSYATTDAHDFSGFPNTWSFSPDGTCLAVLKPDRPNLSVAIVDCMTGREIFNYDCGFPSGSADSLAWSKDGRSLCMTGGYQVCCLNFEAVNRGAANWSARLSRLWDSRYGQFVLDHPCYLNDRLIVCGNWADDGTLFGIDAQNGKELTRVHFSKAAGTPLGSTWSPACSRAFRASLKDNSISFVIDPTATTDLSISRDLAKDSIQRFRAATAGTSDYSILGQWYAKLGMNVWAIDMLEKARDKGESVSSLTLARCYWKLDQYDKARQEFSRALTLREAAPNYLRLCINAVTRSSTSQ